LDLETFGFNLLGLDPLLSLAQVLLSGSFVIDEGRLDFLGVSRTHVFIFEYELVFEFCEELVIGFLERKNVLRVLG